ncbi:MAG: hypothetical protein KF746_25380 [Chitinophagaceae bacterium]|nr:hypothetical protein [Chitinophagaceae bacterium]
MKQLLFVITVILLTCLACNDSSRGITPNDPDTNDSAANNRAADPTPGLGYDPTRSDMLEKNPLRDQDTGDSTGPANSNSPTLGVGNDPTRNAPSNRYGAPGDKNKGREDTKIE